MAEPSQAQELTLYSYWRSSASWRVRIALNLQGVPHNYHYMNLLKKEHRSEDYTTNVNPGATIPSIQLKKDGRFLFQSIAIMEYLEETYADKFNCKSLLPGDAYDRAIVREIVNLIVCDIHPIQNMRVLEAVGEEKKVEWAKSWILRGFEAVEKVLQKTAGTCCVGNEVTMADACLVPQAYNAVRFGVDMTKFPIISRINDSLSKLEPFVKSHPENQADKQ